MFALVATVTSNNDEIPALIRPLLQEFANIFFE